MSEIKDIVIPILKNIQTDVSVLKSDVSVMKENIGRIDMRLGAVESHMSGFMATSRYLEIEVNELRGRVEAPEDAIKSKK